MIITLQTLIFFRESLLYALDRLLRPYYKKFSLTFGTNGDVSDEETDEQVFAEYNEERGVVFYPPVYLQRYAAVSDCLMDERWCGKLEKVVDLGYHDMSFIKYLKELPGIKYILGVDIDTIPLRCSSDLIGGDDYIPKRENPLQVTLFKGNAADPDYRLIGCDAVVSIEMIEHMLPHDLDRLIHTVFGFIKPHIAIFTTPNGDFNVLFKSLEKNGLRRLDHFFEWSREQFHDWCSNIVTRYPQYEVSCKGIGPGPTGTVHLGCCSQMALFVAKEYNKQQNLNLNSLALVRNTPSPNSITNLISSWESSDVLSEHIMIGPPPDIDSFTEIHSPKPSCITIVLTPPPFSADSLTYSDKTSQCNLDNEAGRNYLMFDDEQCFDVVVPRKKLNNRVYIIEDVNSRLNCTTLQVKKFSKKTQNLMAKDKLDTLVHTRDVVDEIRHLTKILNFNKQCANQLPDAGTATWCNINWGDNAPYWNQYYKIVREYNYPFETKSEECRILDLISDEINRLIDAQFDDEFSVELNKLEIPIEYLMSVVDHITDDVDRVKDLLEWNGYEVRGDMVIHSRLVVDNASVATQDDDWQETDTYSEWDSTDMHSTSLSDGSTIIPDYHARCLRRALDLKVRKLRSMLTADEDITTELDRIVCRLMKLALRTSKGRSSPPPTKWMQCKLLHMLTLTEKAIERRKRHFIESYPLKAIDYEEKSEDMIALAKIKEDDTALNIVNKYKHLVKQTDGSRPKYRFIDLDLEDNLSVSSSNFDKDYEYIERHSPSLYEPEATLIDTATYHVKELVATTESTLERTQAWLEDDIEIVPYPDHGADFDNSSGDTDESATNAVKYYKRKLKGKKSMDLKCVICKKSHSKAFKQNRFVERNKERSCKTKLIKQIPRKRSSNNSLGRTVSNKYASVDYKTSKIKPGRKHHKTLYPTVSKPIPVSLINLCHPEVTENVEYFKDSVKKVKNGYQELSDQPISEIATIKESLLISIVMEDAEESIALRRTIGTDAHADPLTFEDETLIRSVSNTCLSENKFDKHNVATGNVYSQTIFLYDIDEPTTSKGIRHIGMDVQCGPDASVPAFSMLSATTSLTKMPKMFTAGIKIGESATDTKIKSTDCSTCTNDTDSMYKTVVPRESFVGIKIKDSDSNIPDQIECSTMTQETFDISNISTPQTLPKDKQLLKSVPSGLEMVDSSSEFCGSVGSSPKSPANLVNARYNSDLDIIASVSKDVIMLAKFSCKYEKLKLSHGGVHVHSYRDKETSEDVMYLGEWQKERPKLSARRKLFQPIINMKKMDSKKKKAISKEVPNKNIMVKRDLNPDQRFLVPRTIDVAKQGSNSRNPTLTVPVRVTKIYKPTKNMTKVTLKLTMSSQSSKIPKPAFVVKKPSLISNITVTKDVERNRISVSNNYMPLYLRRKSLTLPNKNVNKNNLNLSLDSAISNTNREKATKTLIRSKTAEIKRDLLKFQNKVPVSKFVVYRNEIVKKKSGTDEQQIKDAPEIGIKRDVLIKRPLSPNSPNSSTCSSPNSIATVRASSFRNKNLSNQRHSTSSHKSNDSESQNATPDRNNKSTVRSKSLKSANGQVSDNKENIPQTSKQYSIRKEERDKFAKSSFIVQKKDVYIAHLKENPPLQLKKLSKHKAQQSNVNTPKPNSIIEKNSSRSQSPSVSKKVSLKSDVSLSVTNNNEHSETSQTSNMVLVIGPQTREIHNSDIPKLDKVDVTNNRLVASWIDTSYEGTDCLTSVMSGIRQVIEDTLDFIDDPLIHVKPMDSETVILSPENDNHQTDLSASPASFKTVITNDYSDILQRDIENVLNRSFDTTFGDESILSITDTRLTVTDFDTLSFKSLTSASKLSEYLSADNELSSSRGNLPSSVDTTSVHDIFERRARRTLAQVQKIPGALASQAFSGFSINGEPLPGDKPDPINFIDSETGSLAVDVTRQATSEELFVSGRSSDSFESCVLDEDAVVPNWLFQIISQQQSAMDELEAPDQLMVPLSVAEPMFDDNGNVVDGGEGPGADAGAGDGRGIHSDHSQDSSGGGTSVSSSDTSSGPQSETILIDPSAFVNQFEMLRDAIGSSVVVLAINDPSESLENAMGSSRQVPAESESDSFSRGESRRTPRARAVAASDVDADVSSLDTDAPDSSDN